LEQARVRFGRQVWLQLPNRLRVDDLKMMLSSCRSSTGCRISIDLSSPRCTLILSESWRIVPSDRVFADLNAKGVAHEVIY
jgi:hypothetical protein